jgi:sulfoacetaldehyde dehydrogenase
MTLEIENNLKNLVQKTKKAQFSLEDLAESKINKILGNILGIVLDETKNFFLSEMAVKETKFGNISDKMKKNLYKTKSLVSEIKKLKIKKPYFNTEKNIYEIYKPLGLICGVTPSTNPIATALNYTINSIKGRNSLIICPNPRSYQTSKELVKLIKEILLLNNVSQEIINLAPLEVLRSDTIIKLFDMCDRNIVTGSKFFISAVKKSIKPYLIFGAGNVPVLIDDKVNLSKVSKLIIESKTFDYSTSCSADSVLIINHNIYDRFINELRTNCVYVLNDKEKQKLDEIYYKRGVINTEIIAKKPSLILEKIGVKIKTKVKLIAYEFSSSFTSHYIMNEKILPLVGITRAKNFDHAINLANNVLNINGKGHSAGIYSDNKNNIIKFSLNVPVSRIIVNQAHSKSAGGNLNNGLKTTLSLGCGNWGGNIINDNLSLKDFCNITRIIHEKIKIKKNYF